MSGEGNGISSPYNIIYNSLYPILLWAPLVAQMVKNPLAMQGTCVRSLGWENPQEKGMATQSCILAWKIPWTEEPGGLQSMGFQRVRHNWATEHMLTQTHVCKTLKNFYCSWFTMLCYFLVYAKWISYTHIHSFFSSVQSLIRVRLFAIPWTAAHQASLSINNSCNLLKLMSIELVMPSNHLILCHPLLKTSLFPSIRVFPKILHISSSHQVAKVLEFQIQHQSFQWIFRINFLYDGLVESPCSPRDSQESSSK